MINNEENSKSFPKSNNKSIEENKEDVHNVSNSRLNPETLYRQDGLTSMTYKHMLSELKSKNQTRTAKTIHDKNIDEMMSLQRNDDNSD